MLAISLKTPVDIRKEIAQRAKEQRLTLNMSQKELADRSGVSLGSVKRFEASGRISLSSLLEISLVLDCLSDFDALFAEKKDSISLFAPEPKKRKRSSPRRKTP